ncbi:MAG: outer membrane protein assembly factor BamD [bacterium]|nr:outer membrane protein assembly factor BamD [bacterium]
MTERSMKIRTLFTVILLTLVLIGFIGCKKKKVELTPEEKGSAKTIYDKAKSRMKRAPQKARLLYKEIMHLYPDSTYTQRAKIGIADSYFKQKDSASLIMAAAEFQEYVSLYPNSPDAVYAKLQIAMCYFRQVRKPGRDQANTHTALKALEAMVKMYPGTVEATEATKMINKCRTNLAAHYYNIGVSNFRLKAYKGAVVRFKQVIDDYPNFYKNDRLFYYAGRSYYGLKNYDSAISFFQRIISDFPKSKLIKRANKMIIKINKAKATAKAAPKVAPKAVAKEGDKK